jgi:hypothetical protein
LVSKLNQFRQSLEIGSTAGCLFRLDNVIESSDEYGEAKRFDSICMFEQRLKIAQNPLAWVGIPMITSRSPWSVRHVESSELPTDPGIKGNETGSSMPALPPMSPPYARHHLSERTLIVGRFF